MGAWGDGGDLGDSTAYVRGLPQGSRAASVSGFGATHPI